jgi:hypothetical protein
MSSRRQWLMLFVNWGEVGRTQKFWLAASTFWVS